MNVTFETVYSGIPILFPAALKELINKANSIFYPVFRIKNIKLFFYIEQTYN